MAIKVKELIRQLKKMPQDSFVHFSDAKDLWPTCSVEAVRDDSVWQDDPDWRTVTLLGPTRFYPQQEETHVTATKRDDVVEDGFGGCWSKKCHNCGQNTIHVVRPGKVQCGNCD